MAEFLKAGGLGSASDSGIPADFAGSMAKEIEDALNALLVSEGRDPVSTENTTATRDRRMMFVAIAQGVVNHLVKNNEAFVVRRRTDNTDVNNRRIDILKVGP